MRNILILLLPILGLLGCADGSNHSRSKGKRTVTLYACDGKVIQTWVIDNYDNFSDGWAMFDVNGHAVKVTGTMVSEFKEGI